MKRNASVFRLPPSAFRLLFALLAPLLMCAGCSLFRFGWTDEVSTTRNPDAKKPSLPAIRRSRDTVGLEIVFAERPIDDPLLSNAALWEGVDTVGELTPETRKRLLRHGFKVGHMSATPNAAVESLLGLTSQSTGTRTPVGRRQLAGQRIVRPLGGDTEVQTSRYFPTFAVQLDDEPGERPGRSKRPGRFEARNARCVLRVKVEQLDDGFAKLQFTPEIHHGRLGWRPMATELGLQGTTAQKIQHLYDQRFTLTLNTGEMAVITADSALPDSLAGRFFIDGDPGSRTQRVLFVRLADVATSRAVIRESRAIRED
jgi:hypothetical protein